MLSSKLESIKDKLKELIDIVDGLKSYDEIPSIDIDLMKQKMLNSYNDVINLNKQGVIVETDNNIETEDTTEPEIELELIEKAEDAPEEAKEFYENIVEENKEEAIPEPIIEAKEDIAIEEEVIEEKIIEEPKQELVEEKEIIEEAPKNKTIEIDKSITSALVSIFASIKNDSETASKIQFTPISDVKSAISINERIGIVSDIFASDNNKFNQCLDKINQTEDINTVISELDKLTDWDIENHNHKIFLEIVYRKFL